MYSHCFKVLPPFLYLLRLARFPSFCHASFSLCFTAGPRGRGACLLTLSAEGSDISESKYMCSNVNHMGGNYGLFVGICRGGMGIWPCVLQPYERPIYNCYTPFTCADSKWWQTLSWHLLLYILVVPCQTAADCVTHKEEKLTSNLNEEHTKQWDWSITQHVHYLYEQ